MVKIQIYTTFPPHVVKIQIYITFTPCHGENSDLHHAVVKIQIYKHDIYTTLL